jgi:hypothetical protein
MIFLEWLSLAKLRSINYFILLAFLTLLPMAGCSKNEFYTPIDQLGLKIPEVDQNSAIADVALDLSYDLPAIARLRGKQDNERIYLMSQTSQSSESKGYGLSGDVVRVLDVERGENFSIWHYVKFRDSGDEGWIPIEFIEILEAAETDLVRQGLCGDFLSKEYAVYPVEIHPLYLENIDKNFFASWEEEDIRILELLQERVCNKARFGYIRTEKDGKRRETDIIIIGHFSDEMLAEEARAEINRELLAMGLSSLVEAKIGSSIILRARPALSEEVREKAKLGPEDFDALMDAHRDGEFGVNFDVVVPTYIPDEYKFESIEIRRREETGDSVNFFNPYYSIKYETSDGSCFFLSGSTGKGGAGADDVQYAEVDSAVFGQVTLMYIKFSRDIDGSFLSFENEQTASQWGSSQLYTFSGCRDTLSLNEAVKVVESMEYLNHPLFLHP